MPEEQDSKTSGRKQSADTSTDTATADAAAATPGNEETPAATAAPDFEPYPGAEFFHGGRNSAIVSALGRRLRAVGATSERLGPDWTNRHRDAVKAWQETLRPKGGGDTSGIPDRVAWERLEVPRVTPRQDG